jgi:hypothetical protein
MQASTSTTVEAGAPPRPSAPDVPQLAPPEWSALRRFGFRCVFAYLLLYNFTVALEYVPVVGEQVYLALDGGWRWFVPWVGKQLFGLDITVFPAGSGDTTFNYVQVFVFAVLALLAATTWTLLDRRRPNYERLHAGLRIYIRYVLAVTMISYGMAKVVQTQFPHPDARHLTQTYGDSSPMGLLWTFMGYSTAYNAFIGASETACGLLLWYRRTTLFGALLTTIVMLNVFVLNMCFDVPVKLYSAHIVLMAVWLMLPDVPRLVSAFALHRAVPGVVIRPLFGRRGFQRAWVALKTLLLGGYLVSSTTGNLEWYRKLQGSESTPLSGYYVVEEFHLDGELRPPLITDAQRWRSLFVSDTAFEGRYSVRIKTMDDKSRWARCKIDAAASTLELEVPGPLGPTGEPSETKTTLFTVREGEGGTWTFDGTFADHAIVATAKRRALDEFPLVNRGFHWINEYPFNR